MTKTLLIAFSAMLMAGAAVYSADAPPKSKLSEVVAVENLALVAAEKIADLEKLLATEESLTYSKQKKLKQLAGILGVIAQVIAEHDHPSDWQNSAPDVRDLARKLAAAESPEEGRRLLERLRKLLKGESHGAPRDTDWAELIDIDSLMSELRQRNSNVGRAVRKLRRGMDEETRDEAVRNAEMLALLGMVTAAEAGHLEDETDVPRWQHYSAEQCESSLQLAAAFRAGDGVAVKAAYSKFKRTCTGCHKDFRD